MGHYTDNQLAKSTTIKVVEKCCHGNVKKEVTKWETKLKSSCHESPCCSPKDKTCAWKEEGAEEEDIVKLSEKKHSKPDKCCDKRSTKAVTGSDSDNLPAEEQGDRALGGTEDTAPITIDSSVFTTEELETLITSLDETG